MNDVEPTAAPKIFKEDCRIDWQRGATEIHNHVRGLSPHPGAWTELRQNDGNLLSVKILKTRIPDTESSGLRIGEISVINREVICGCGDGHTIILDTVQPAGKKAMPAPDFVRGLHTDSDGTLPSFE